MHLRHPFARGQRKAQTFTAVKVTLCHGARQVADAADIGCALGHRDRAARVQQVEAVRSFEHLLVSGQRELGLDQVLGLLFMRSKGGEQKFGIAVLEVIGRLLDLVLFVHVPIAEPLCPAQVVDVVHALQVHGQALQAVGDLAGDGPAVNAADLLEVGELRDLHAVEPDFPAQAPGAQRRVFPVVFDKADVVLLEVKAQRFERAEVELEDVAGRGFEHHLVLVVVLQSVGVFAVAAVFRAATGLHVSCFPGLRAKCS